MMHYRLILSIGFQPRTGSMYDSAFQFHNSANVAFARAADKQVVHYFT